MMMLLAAHADELELESSVIAVTVHTDGARVVRLAKVRVPVGRHELIFGDLPITLDADSLSAEGEGHATITGIDVRRVTGLEDRDVRVAAIKAERQRLADAVAVHRDTVSRVGNDLRFLRSLKPKAPGALEEATFLADDAAAQLAELAGQISDDMSRLLVEQRRAEREIRALLAEDARLEREVDTLESRGGSDSRRVAVGVDAAVAGTVELRLSYLVGGASWEPRYDARYRPNDGVVELALSAAVNQRTGESWDGVALALSTAPRRQRVAPPELSPFVLQEAAPSSRRAMAGKAQAVSAFEFEARHPEDVPADGTVRRIALDLQELQAQVVHRVVSRHSASAWLTARVVVGAEYALLPGTVSAYLGTAYVGDGRVASTPPEGELDLSFGVDDRVQVNRTPLEDVSEGTKPLGSRERQRWGFETTVANHTGETISVEVVEQVPATREAEWEVSVATSPEVEVPNDGVFVWKQDLANDAEQLFTLEYEVSWPQDQRPLTLD